MQCMHHYNLRTTVKKKLTEACTTTEKYYISRYQQEDKFHCTISFSILHMIVVRKSENYNVYWFAPPHRCQTIKKEEFSYLGSRSSEDSKYLFCMMEIKLAMYQSAIKTACFTRIGANSWEDEDVLSTNTFSFTTTVLLITTDVPEFSLVPGIV